MDLTVLLTPADLRRRFGPPTYDRGEAYVRDGRVLACKHQVDDDGDLAIRGEIAGSQGFAYGAFVSIGLDAAGVWFVSRCDCPMRADCKHVVALVLTVHAEHSHHPSGGERDDRRWERQLASVLDEFEDAADGATRDTRTDLGLMLELSTPGRDAARRTTRSPPRGALRMRPVKLGKRGQWVRSGISFHDLPRLRHDRSVDAAQLTVLSELVAVHRAESGHIWYHSSEAHLPVAGFGSALWSTLERADRAGVPLVAGAGLDTVHVRAEPVRVELDVNADDQASHLRLGVRVHDEWYDAAVLDLVGDPAHGIALWRTDHDHAAVTLAPLDRPLGRHIRQLLAVGADLRVPAAGRDHLLSDYLPRLQRHLPVLSSDGSVPIAEPAVPRLALTVTWVAAGEVSLAWTWRYAVGGTDRVYGLHETRGLRGVRRPDLEQPIVAGLDLTDDQVFWLCDSHRLKRGLVANQTFTHGTAVGFVDDMLPVLERLAADGSIELDEVGGRPDYRSATHAPVIRFEARDDESDHRDGRTDWLDLEVVISIDGEYLALAHLLETLTMGHRRIVLPSGLHIDVDRPEFAQLAELVTSAGELHEQPRDGVRVGHHDLGLWDELAEVGIVDAQAQQWVRAAQALRAVTTLPAVDLVGVKATLRHYQRDGFHWLAFLWRAGLGGILADDMGLGKTLQTLALIAHARDQGAAPFLVVAPTSVVSTWHHEAAEFTPGLVVRTVTQAHARRGSTIAEVVQGADVVVTSYTLLRLEIEQYGEAEIGWGGLVLDEAQTVKNHSGKTHQCVRRLDVPFRVALTGTPMENRLMELWSLLSIVAPGLYTHPARFKELVADPVEKEGDAAALDRFRRRVRPFLLRRTKALVAADLPPKQEQILDVQLTPRHRRIYDTHLQRERQTVLGLVDDFDKHRIAIFRSLTRLRQLSLDPALLDSAHGEVGSAKLDVLVDHLTELVAEGHRALVFSQFTSYLSRVRTRLDQEGFTSTYLDGRTRKRAEVVEEFRRGSASVFLISLKAGGVGLTLTEADYVFVLDPWWNPAVEAQAVDRAHRIGQHRPVMVYRLVATSTIEEKVMQLKARKAQLFAQVVDGEGAGSTAIDADDIRAMLEP